MRWVQGMCSRSRFCIILSAMSSLHHLDNSWLSTFFCKTFKQQMHGHIPPGFALFLHSFSTHQLLNKAGITSFGKHPAATRGFSNSYSSKMKLVLNFCVLMYVWYFSQSKPDNSCSLSALPWISP